MRRDSVGKGFNGREDGGDSCGADMGLVDGGEERVLFEDWSGTYKTDTRLADS